MRNARQAGRRRESAFFFSAFFFRLLIEVRFCWRRSVSVSASASNSVSVREEGGRGVMESRKR